MENPSTNPYQAPETSAQEEPVREYSDLPHLTKTAYRDGDDLLFRKDFVSPYICLQTGEQLENTAKPFKFPLLGFLMNKHPLWKVIHIGVIITFFYFSLIHFDQLQPLILLPFLAFAFGQSKFVGHTIFYYHKSVLSGQIKMSLIYTIVFLGPGIFFFIYGQKHFDNQFWFLGIPFFILYFISIARLSRLKPITKQGDYYRLRGCHPHFLATLPDIAGNADELFQESDKSEA